MNYHNKNEISVTVMPTYKCNNGCAYCYIPEDDRRFGYYTDYFISSLKRRLNEIKDADYKISNIELYGGDLGLLKASDLADIVTICRQYTNDLTITHTDVEQCLQLGFKPEQINLSLNIERRDFQVNIRKSFKHPDVGIITVVTADILMRSVEELFKDWYGHLTGYLTFMPLSNRGVHNPFPYVSNLDYCAFIIRALEYYHTHQNECKFVLTNSIQVHDAINGLYSPRAVENVFITPDGAFARVDNSDYNSEKFAFYSDFKSWLESAQTDDIKFIDECGYCEHFSHCLADHFIPKDTEDYFQRDIGDICNGGIPIIQWALEHPEYGYGLRLLNETRCYVPVEQNMGEVWDVAEWM